ncbi:hypothetical protein JW960_08400 [candidate division KSB1 bacterium]|nr:hypothetical protein [candidate division KSB1 bacterium]
MIRSISKMVFLVLMTAIFFMTACNKQQPNDVKMEPGVERLAKAGPYTLESIQPELKKLMKYLKRNPEFITPEVLTRTADRHATISDLGLTDRFPETLPLDNGNTFEIYIELFDGSVGSGKSVEDAEVYLTLDVDRFAESAGFKEQGNGYSFQAEVAATLLNRKKGVFKDDDSVKELTISDKHKNVEFLWFLVGGEERLSPENEERNYQDMLAGNPGLAKAQESTTTVYFWLTKLKLKADKDWGSNEEFELYYHWWYNAGRYYAFPATTEFIFDGGVHMDFSGNDRWFPDVNEENGYYVMSHPIAVAVPTDYTWKIAAVEDDYDKGEHKNSEWQGTGLHYQYMHGLEIDINGNISIEGAYFYWILDDPNNDDDVYENSLITENGNNCVQNNEWEIDTPHVTYWLRKGTVAQAGSW